MSMPVQYPTDLTDAQWQLLQSLLPPRKWRPGGPGRPPCDLRQVLNGMLYVTKTGCQWDMLSPSFGRWKTVYGYFNDWSRAGHWQSMMETLNWQERRRQGRNPTPSAGSVDSQSIKTATQGEVKGYDAGKQVNGRNLNQTLHNKLERRTFVCFTMAEIMPATRTLRLSNCGCPYPYHYKATSGEVLELQMDGYPLGIRSDASYTTLDVLLEAGDFVVFCSDGIIEAANSEEEIFGFEQTAETIRAGCAEGLSAEALIDRLISAVQTFAGDEPQGDDITCVVVRVEG